MITMKSTFIIIFLASFLFFASCKQKETQNLKQTKATVEVDVYRPNFHFTPEKNWMNDPNGMFFYDGEFHLYYQHNPFGNKWGHMSWGHAVSKDMISWEHLPVAIPEEDGVAIFSGSAVVDWNNTSGFGKDGNPPIIAIYTGFVEENKVQYQCIAYSNDKGRTFTKYEANPVIDLKHTEFRDPKVFWYAPEQKWVMSVALSKDYKIQFYESKNLIDWVLTGEFGPAGGTGGVWECPDLFPLTTEDGETRWILEVDLGEGSVAGGSGGQYFIGNFTGKTFVLDESQNAAQVKWLDYGKDFYAAVSWSDIIEEDGRRLWIGWMNNWQYAQEIPTGEEWRSHMSLARHVQLKKDETGSFYITQTIVDEFNSYQNHVKSTANETLDGVNSILKSDNFKTLSSNLKATIKKEVLSAPLKYGIFSDSELVFQVSFTLQNDQLEVSVDRNKAGNVSFHDNFPFQQSATVAIANKGEIPIQIITDKSSVEVLVNNGALAFTNLIFPKTANNTSKFSSTNNSFRFTSLEVSNIR